MIFVLPLNCRYKNKSTTYRCFLNKWCVDIVDNVSSKHTLLFLNVHISYHNKLCVNHMHAHSHKHRCVSNNTCLHLLDGCNWGLDRHHLTTQPWLKMIMSLLYKSRTLQMATKILSYTTNTTFSPLEGGTECQQ